MQSLNIEKTRYDPVILLQVKVRLKEINKVEFFKSYLENDIECQFSLKNNKVIKPCFVQIDHYLIFESSSLISYNKALSLYFKAMMELSKNIGNSDFRIDNLREYCNVSSERLNRVFKKINNGLTVIKSLIKMRMIEASKYLRLLDKPIKAVAYAVGYKDEANFSKAFKNEFNMTPTMYRTTVLNGMSNF